MTNVEEEIQAIFRRLGEITLDVGAQQTLAVAEAEVLGVVAQQEARWKDDAKKLQAMYELVRDKRTQYWKELQDLKKAEAERNKLFTLCDFCNKEFEITFDKTNTSIFQKCPHCQRYNKKWLRLGKALLNAVSSQESACEGEGENQPPKTETSVAHGVGIGGGQNNDVVDKKKVL